MNYFDEFFRAFVAGLGIFSVWLLVIFASFICKKIYKRWVE